MKRTYLTVFLVLILGASAAYGTLSTRAAEQPGRVILTFDDSSFGFSNDQGFQIMQEFGYRGVSYVLASTFSWCADEPFFESLELGWEIGGHTWSHPRLDQLSTSQIRYEIIDSTEWIEDHFDTDLLSFSYPNSRGSNDPRVIQALEDAGYLYAREGLRYWNHRSWDGSQGYQIISYAMRHADYTSILPRLLRDVRENGIAVVMFHRVNTGLKGSNSLTPSEFRYILQQFKNEGFDVVTFQDLEGPTVPPARDMTAEEWENFWGFLIGKASNEIRAWLNALLSEWKVTHW